MPRSERIDCVVDTHAWIWALGGDDRRIGRAARRALARTTAAGVPAISQLEAADMFAAGRMATDLPLIDWLKAAVMRAPFQLAALTPDIAAAVADLAREGFHRDPADRMIYATARVLDVPLLTVDERIRAFDRRLPKSRGRRVIWD